MEDLWARRAWAALLSPVIREFAELCPVSSESTAAACAAAEEAATGYAGTGQALPSLQPTLLTQPSLSLACCPPTSQTLSQGG